jgi:beta-N-acetylhexosaminidase
VEALSTLVGKPANLALGQQVADDAITLVRDNGKLLPLKPSGTVPSALPYQRVEEPGNRLLLIILVDDVRTENGRMLEREMRARVPDVRVLYADSRTAAAMANDIASAVAQAQSVVAAVYVVPTAGKAAKVDGMLKNSVALPNATGALLQAMLDRAAEKTIVLAMGNPYLAQDFPAIRNYVCAYSNATVSEISAARALFGELAIRGHLPVTIPNFAARGQGIERPSQAAHGGLQYAHPQSAERQ